MIPDNLQNAPISWTTDRAHEIIVHLSIKAEYMTLSYYKLPGHLDSELTMFKALLSLLFPLAASSALFAEVLYMHVMVASYLFILSYQHVYLI